MIQASCVFLAALWAAGAAGAASFAPPEGCAHLATVHQARCNTFQVTACPPQSQDRRIHHFGRGELLGIVDYRAGLVEVDYRELAGQQPVHITYEGLDAADAFDPLAEGAMLNLAGGYVAGVPPRTLVGRATLRFGPGSRPIDIGGRAVREIDASYFVEVVASGRKLRRRAIGVEYFDPELGSTVGYRLRISSNFAKPDVEDFAPLQILIPGDAGFAENAAADCSGVAGADNPRAIAVHRTDAATEPAGSYADAS